MDAPHSRHPRESCLLETPKASLPQRCMGSWLAWQRGHTPRLGAQEEGGRSSGGKVLTLWRALAAECASPAPIAQPACAPTARPYAPSAFHSRAAVACHTRTAAAKASARIRNMWPRGGGLRSSKEKASRQDTHRRPRRPRRPSPPHGRRGPGRSSHEGGSGLGGQSQAPHPP